MAIKIVNSSGHGNKGVDFRATETARDLTIVDSEFGTAEIGSPNTTIVRSRFGQIIRVVKTTPWWYSLGLTVIGAALGVLLDRLAVRYLGW